MMLIDLVNQTTNATGLAPATLAASTQGNSNDLSNCELSTNALVEIGTFTANTTQVWVQVEESADGSTNWTAISGMTLNASTTGIYAMRGQRTHRYARVNALTVAGTTPSSIVAAQIIAQRKYTNPTSGVSRAPST